MTSLPTPVIRPIFSNQCLHMTSAYLIAATCEMIAIMQEYGEVVLCVGSSLNIQNVPMFLLADCRYICSTFSTVFAVICALTLK